MKTEGRSLRAELSAAILAGGRATRFGGRDKSALMVEGRTILERQIAALGPLTDDILVVGGAAGAAPPVARHIADRVEGCGPLGGLDAALEHARGELLILLACDMPFVTTGFLAHLTDLASGSTGGPGQIAAVVPRTERGYHPLCAVYRRTVRDAATRCLADRRLKMLDLLADLRVHVAAPADIERFG